MLKRPAAARCASGMIADSFFHSPSSTDTPHVIRDTSRRFDTSKPQEIVLHPGMHVLKRCCHPISDWPPGIGTEWAFFYMKCKPTTCSPFLTRLTNVRLHSFFQ